MDMKNINKKRFNFFMIDHKVSIFGITGNIVMESKKAWDKFLWTRKYFEEKPQEGYFIWVKKQVDFPLSTCISIASPKIKQNLKNLLVIEKNLKIKANVLCYAAFNNLYGSHNAKGKIILKEGSNLEYNHIHKWGDKDFVSPNYEFILEKDSKLIYTYKNIYPPEKLNLKTKVIEKENSSSNINIIIKGEDTKIDIYDSVNFIGKNSNSIVKLRLVAGRNCYIFAESELISKNISKGHIDCQGLLIDKKGKISLIPRLILENKDSQLTHEASIGKISENELIYLRSRGLSEEEAVGLITTGFLEI